VSQMRNRIRELQRIFAAVFRQQGDRPLATQLIEKTWKQELVALGESVPRADFQKWIAENEPDEDALSEQVAESYRTQSKPVISLLTPVWNPRTDILEATIRSVLAKTYDQWELCPIDGGLTKRLSNCFTNLKRRWRRFSP